MNVALYARSRSESAWTLTEQAVRAEARTTEGVAIGASVMRWDGDRLVVDIDERTPLGRRVRGKVVLTPETQSELELTLDPRSEHRWWPVAPRARIEVDMPELGVRFAGHGYHDANAGDVSLDASFRSWSWARGRAQDASLITYDVTLTDSSHKSLALAIPSRGEVTHLASIEAVSLGRTRWGLARVVRAEPGGTARVVRSLEDGPFYARALVETRLEGRPITVVHETLAADRLRRRWVRFCTSFRMRYPRMPSRNRS
ncbi:MAG: carotenoid 1,2-hydratase [Labilithrix sp.]